MATSRTRTVTKPAEATKRILERVGSVFVGGRELLTKVLAASLANGHVLFEDNPGLGKTLLAKAFARSVGARTVRVQFTPDLLPADILGTEVWDGERSRFVLRRGPIFTNVLLADEINRAPPKTQSALLEAMEERQVTLAGETMPLAPPFAVLATQNPIEQEGTYPLPEAQLDRFMVRLSTGYPRDLAAERQIMRRRLGWQRDDPTDALEPAVTVEEFAELQGAVESDLFVHDAILDYIGTIVRSLRTHPSVEVGPSPRGCLAVMRLARAFALIQGIDFVTPDHVRALAVDALAHRMVLNPDEAIEGLTAQKVVEAVVNQTGVPTRFRRSD